MPDCETLTVSTVFPHAVKFFCEYGHHNFTNYLRSWIHKAIRIFCDQKLSVVKVTHFGIIQFSEYAWQKKMKIKWWHKHLANIV